MSEEVETKKELKAKDVSLWGQILAVLWTIGFGAFYIISNIKTIDPMIIVYFGLAIVGEFSPVYLNLLMEKICHKDI